MILSEKNNENKATVPVKITPKQRRAIIHIGKEAGLNYVYEVVELLISRYMRPEVTKEQQR